MKLLFSFIICLWCFCADAQNDKLLLDIKGLPVREGKIYKYEQRGCSSEYAAEIISNSDSVFSNTNGTISFAGGIGDEFVVVVKTGKSHFVVFSKIKSINVKKGNSISKGDFIGTIKPDDDNLLLLAFMICDDKGRFFSEAKTIAFLKENTIPLCSSNDHPIVAR